LVVIRQVVCSLPACTPGQDEYFVVIRTFQIPARSSGPLARGGGGGIGARGRTCVRAIGPLGLPPRIHSETSPAPHIVMSPTLRNSSGSDEQVREIDVRSVHDQLAALERDGVDRVWHRHGSPHGSQ
jgi:hypothetical protein